MSVFKQSLESQEVYICTFHFLQILDYLSNGKTIIPLFGQSLLHSAAHPLCGSQTVFVLTKNYFRSPATQRIFGKN